MEPGGFWRKHPYVGIAIGCFAFGLLAEILRASQNPTTAPLFALNVLLVGGFLFLIFGGLWRTGDWLEERKTRREGEG